VGNFQPSLRDWSGWDGYPALRAGLSSAVPSGLVPIRPDGWFVFSKVSDREICLDELGSFRIALTQEKVEVAALIGLQYRILK
jgi:hypothetical protein